MKFDFKPPYNKNRCSFLRKEYSKRKGVYIIKEENTIVYVGMSKNCVYSTFYRHFQNWNDPHFNRIVYPKTRIRATIIETENPEIEERKLIRVLTPRDNRELYVNEVFDNNRGSWWIDEAKKMEQNEIPF